MPYLYFLWNDEIIAHLQEHHVTTDEFEYVVRHPRSKGISRTTGKPVAFGHTLAGRYLVAVYDEIDELTVLPITAYEVPEPR